MPQIKRFRRLNIVMVIQQQSVGTTTAQFTINSGWSAFGVQTLRTEARIAQEVCHHAGHFSNAIILRGDAWLATELFKQFLSLVRMLLKIGGWKIGHIKPFLLKHRTTRKLIPARIDVY